MKTLRDEARRFDARDAYWDSRRDSFWCEYGDWRVVEGVLSINEHGDSGRYEVLLDCRESDGGIVAIGDCCGLLKLILPPEGAAAKRMECACAMCKSNKWTLDDCRRVWLGEAVDLPPEEERSEPTSMPLDVKVDHLETQLDLQEQREERILAVVDRYEKALRELAEVDGKATMGPQMPRLIAAVSWAGRIAREALRDR